jgi:HSP20 family molecular chaperone IbpA
MTTSRANGIAVAFTASSKRNVPLERRITMIPALSHVLDLFELLLSAPRSPLESPKIVNGENSLIISFELLGFEKGKISVLRENNMLTVSATREKGGKADLDKREITQMFLLPSGLDPDKNDTEYKDGILVITLPKLLQARARKIEVK